MIRLLRAYTVYALFLLLTPAIASGQAHANSGASAARTAYPEPPELPESIHRDADGRATIRAYRLTEPLRFDGALDDPIYPSTLPITDSLPNTPAHPNPPRH